MNEIDWARWVRDNPSEAAHTLWLAEQNASIRIDGNGFIWANRAAIGNLNR